jgi:hypothetical protein
MTEATKTIAIVAISLAVLIAGIVTRPQPPQPPKNNQVGKSLFAKLDDPLKAKRMRIVTYDDGAGKAREFEVAQVGGVWSLPSHKNYPADAKQQMSDAATALVDLKVDGIASEDPEQHALYGVVEPDPAKDQFGQKGIGKLISIEDESSKPLARIIIGKEDKAKADDGAGSSQAKMRFVRVPGQNIVYRAEFSADKFSPKFENWIETDLLKLNPWDVSNVELRDYTVQEGLTREGQVVPTLRQRGDIDLAFNDKDSKWTLKKLVEYKQGKPVEEKLSSDQELNATKLNEMKTALDDLKIVNVERKPARMSANMKAGQEFMNDIEALRDLIGKGFTPAQVGENEFDIKSNDGEAIVGMKDGVEYVLRFGDIAGVDSGDEKDEESKNDKGKDEAEKGKDNTDTLKLTEKKGASVNRYVMVMARFNSNLLEKPELEPVPEIKKAPEKSDDKKGDAGKAAAKTDAKSGKAKADAAKSEPDKAKTDSTENEEEDLEAQEVRRDKIEKENKRKQDEYDEKVKKGEERVKELNGRFADWYYVISDDTYRKIHLGIDDIIKKKLKEEKDDQAGPARPTDPFNPATKGAGKVAPVPAGKK